MRKRAPSGRAEDALVIRESTRDPWTVQVIYRGNLNTKVVQFFGKVDWPQDATFIARSRTRWPLAIRERNKAEARARNLRKWMRYIRKMSHEFGERHRYRECVFACIEAALRNKPCGGR